MKLNKRERADVAQDMLRRLALCFDGQPYQYLAPQVFGSTERDLVDTSNTLGDYDGNNGQFDFTAAGSQLATQNLLDADFAASTDTLATMVAGLFVTAKTGLALPTLEVTRSGGLVWQAVPLTGAGDFYKTLVEFATEATANPLATHTGYDGQLAFDATGTRKLAVQFNVAGKAWLRRLKDFVAIKSGLPAGAITFTIYGSTGAPATDIVATNIKWQHTIRSVDLSAGTNTFDLDVLRMLYAGNYWLVVEVDDTYRAAYTVTDYVALRVDSAAGNGRYAWDGTTWNLTAGTGLAFYADGFIYDLRMRVTGQRGTTQALLGVHAMYGEIQNVSAVDGKHDRNVFIFDGQVDNTSTFTLNFVPDTALLAVYDTNTGQVYKHAGEFGPFQVNGLQVIFPANAFNRPGMVALVIEQGLGYSFDGAQQNAALLADNRLGSTNAALDKSVSGEGILLRAAVNGKLVDASLTWNGSFYVWQFSEVT